MISSVNIVRTIVHVQFIEETFPSPDILGFGLMTRILRTVLDEGANATDDRRIPFLVWKPRVTKLRDAP